MNGVIGQRMGLAVGQELALRTSPVLVQFATVLQMSSSEIETVVERELARNAALSRPERRLRCWYCDGTGCPSCRSGPPLDPDGRHAVAPAEEADRSALLAAMAARLTSPVEHRALRWIADSLDERGLLRREDRLAIDLPGDVVDRVLQVMRSEGSPGLGAPTIAEALVLQVEAHPDAPAELAHVLLHHAKGIVGGELEQVAEAVGAPIDALAEALAWMRHNIEPPTGLPVGGTTPVGVAPPDLIVVRHPDDQRRLVVDVPERRRLGVVVDDEFARLAAADSEAAEAVAAAQRFVDRLEGRWATLRAVARAAVAAQRPWILGSAGLRPLTRREVAERIGCHESTVSRSVRGRRMLLPNGRTVLLAELFPTAPVTKALLAELARSGRYGSDAALARELTARGHPVARRTVAKYRAELGIVGRPRPSPGRLAT